MGGGGMLGLISRPRIKALITIDLRDLHTLLVLGEGNGLSVLSIRSGVRGNGRAWIHYAIRLKWVLTFFIVCFCLFYNVWGTILLSSHFRSLYAPIYSIYSLSISYSIHN